MLTIPGLLVVLWPLLGFQLVLMIWALIDLSRRHHTRYLQRWVWAIIIIVVATIGPIAYLLLGREHG